MKCTAIALLASGAYAIKDTTPPVMSISLSGTPVHQHAFSKSCDVCTNSDEWCGDGWSATDATAECADPVCEVHDHHQTDVDCVRQVTLINEDGYVNEGNGFHHPDGLDHNDADHWDNHAQYRPHGTNPWDQFGAAPIGSYGTKLDPSNPIPGLVSIAHDYGDGDTCRPDNPDLTDPGTANRRLRSLWMYTYNAMDLSLNAADTVSFALTLTDSVAASMSSYSNGIADSISTHNDEACDQGEAGDVATLNVDATTNRATADSYSPDVNPCERIATTNAQATDDYDPDTCRNLINPNIKIAVNELSTFSSWATQPAMYDSTTEDRRMNTHGDAKGSSTWYIHYYVCDNAGQFGQGGEDNCNIDGHATNPDIVTVNFKDNVDPVVVLNPRPAPGNTDPDFSLATHNGTGDEALHAGDVYECGTAGDHKVVEFVEAGAQCRDAVMAWTGSQWQWPLASIEYGANGAPTHTIQNEYEVIYTCEDGAVDETTQAATVTRTVLVVDTEKPTLTLQGDTVIQESTGQGNINSAGTHTGSTYCAQALADGTITDEDACNAQYGYENSSGTFDAAGLLAAYECTDACMGTDTTTVVTLHQGFDCTGSLIGEKNSLDDFPEYTTGEYSIKYRCYDNAENIAGFADWPAEFVTGGETGENGNWDQKCRNIQNVDHTRPIIQILGSNNMILEATHEGNYIDDGATCSDEVDGVISQNVEVSGDVVNLSKVGTYTITYNCKDSAGNAAPSIDRTVHVKQTSCPTCDFNTDSSTTALQQIKHEASFDYTDAPPVCTDTIDGIVTTEYTVYNDAQEETNFQSMVGTTGTYYVTYRAKNSVGLWNDGEDDTTGEIVGCRGSSTHYIRTINVMDTLKPVITLTVQDENGVDVHVKGHGGETSAHTIEIHHDADDMTTYGTQANPAVNPITGSEPESLMAEEATSTGVNGWVLGAVASAVTGLALLGFSQRKTTVATSVPV